MISSCAVSARGFVASRKHCVIVITVRDHGCVEFLPTRLLMEFLFTGLVS